METAFEREHRDSIVGALTTIDRLIVHGHLRSLRYRGGFDRYLDLQGLKTRDFKGHVLEVSAQVKEHAQKLATKAGRPFIYQTSVVRGKDDLARAIAKRDGVAEGLVCVFSTLEMAWSFTVVRGSIAPRQRRCLHLYFYMMDREFGLMHIQLQTWFPFRIQIWVNGREWLARQLDKRGVGYLRYENTFVHIDDLETASRLCEGLSKRKWWRLFDALARKVNPVLPKIQRLGFGTYYWSIDACEIATDVMWESRRKLLGIRDDLFDHAMRAFSAMDVVRFLGRKILPGRAGLESAHRRFAAQGDANLAQRRRPEARRIKHRVRHNSIKMYDKWSVLRVETVINNPYEFRVLRFEKDKRGRRRGRWMRMGKGIQNLPRFVEVGSSANRRYLDALAVVKPTSGAIAELDGLCRGRVVRGRRHARFNPVAPGDCQLFAAVLAGAHAINGFRNRDLQAHLYSRPAGTPDEARRRCNRVCRLIGKLRGHRLVAKVPGSRLYRVTPRGNRVMAAALRFRHADFPEAMAA